MTMGDLLYERNCLGKDRQLIQIYKVRTMELNADKRLEEVADGGFDSFGKPLCDSRIIFVGRFLRKYWIDELPQLYNLARGDIKIVGIRPKDEITWQRYPSEIMQRALRQKPGLMGISYAFAYSENFEDHLAQLREYLDRWEKNPTKTDRNYFSRIVQNIIIGGTRSC